MQEKNKIILEIDEKERKKAEVKPSAYKKTLMRQDTGAVHFDDQEIVEVTDGS